jgi:putative ABC transport system permease protein
MGTLRNIMRRRTRALLTIFGITIGVLALVVMGAMAEKLNLLVDGGIRYYGDKVTVTDAGNGGVFGGPLSVTKVRKIEQFKGVRRASASLGMLLDPKQTSSMGVPPMIMGTDLRQRGYESFAMTWSEGRELASGDKGKCALGSDMALKLNAHVGDRVKLRDEYFTVVGIADKTLTAPDNTAMILLADAQRLYIKDLPSAIAGRVNPKDMCTSIAVYPEVGANPEVLAIRLNHGMTGVKASGPRTFKEQVEAQMAMFNGIIFSVALISLVVGGMSVVNTMTMTVAERTREIGIRKAIGGGTAAVMRQFIAESGVIGLLGGVTGLAIGVAIAWLLNLAGESSGTMLFLVTSRLAAGSLVFAVALGVVAGIYPAMHAARLNPVQALRYD